MKSFHPISPRFERTLLAAIVVLFAGVSIVGITWGLPSRQIDRFLFGDAEPWSGEKIYRLAGAGSKFSPDRGADVDFDPLVSTSDEPVLLTGTDEDVAKIYLRYRLYTYQPDEMITMMALAGMRPRELNFDPRLYQYGGAFIYPVGALIGACGWLGLIDVRSDVVYYLDNPDEFGKFYVVARAYSAAWGVLGVLIVFAIARRIGGGVWGSRAGSPPTGGMGKRSLRVPESLRSAPVPKSEPGAQATGHPPTPDDVEVFGSPTAKAMGHPTKSEPETPAMGHPCAPVTEVTGSPSRGSRAGLLAGLLFALMPVVVCMSHEGKPHLPGAVLMLAAVLFAMRYLSATAAGSDRSARRRDWWLMCICCGAAFGMVLSSLPIFVLIPLVAWLGTRRREGELQHPDRPVIESEPEAQATGETSTCAMPTLAWACSSTDGSTTPGGTLAFKARFGQASKQTVVGVGIATAVYLVTNPYIVINAITNREVLRSNFGNSLAMYDVARIGEGFVRVLELTVEGATLPVLVVGAIALLVALWRVIRRTTSEPGAQATGHRTANAHSDDIFGSPTAEAMGHPVGVRGMGEGTDATPARLRSGFGLGDAWRHPATEYLPLIVPAAVFFVQFVLIGAGKPAEYGRFGIFPNTALAIGAACVLTRRWTKLREIVNWIPAVFVLIWAFMFMSAYVDNFSTDTNVPRPVFPGGLTTLPLGTSGPDEDLSRIAVPETIAVVAEPAPYCFPPIVFTEVRMLLFSDYSAAVTYRLSNVGDTLFARPADYPAGYHRRATSRWTSRFRPEYFPEYFLRLTTRRHHNWRYANPFRNRTKILSPISWANKPFEVLWPEPGELIRTQPLQRRSIDTKKPNP